MLQKLKSYRIDSQYRRPRGAVGQRIGRGMARDHRPENTWTVAILDPQPDDHVLELGFGPGVAIQALTKRITSGHIAGVDYSHTMVAAARQRNAGAIRRGLADLRYGDVAALPFDDQSFDIAFGIHTIYFWSRPLEALREVLRVLKPGGRLGLTILPRERWNPDDPTAPVGTPVCRPYTTAELERMLLVAGFSAT